MNRHGILYLFHADSQHRNPFDGHTLGPVIADLEKLTGVETRRIHVDKGYRGHNHKEKFRVWITGQVRRVTRPIRRKMKRRAAVEPVIGHTKAEHHLGRNYLKGRDGDRSNAVLAAAGYNFSTPPARAGEAVARPLPSPLPSTTETSNHLKIDAQPFFTADFQAKKFDGSGRKASLEEIQRFRGAIGGHIAKGIFFTMTTFSEDARREARTLGKIEIELVALDRILYQRAHETTPLARP